MKGLIYIIYITYCKQRKKYNNTQKKYNNLFIFVRIALYKPKPISSQDCKNIFLTIINPISTIHCKYQS